MKTKYPVKSKAERNAEWEALAEMVQNFGPQDTEAEQWIRLSERYSDRNVMLILSQMEDATEVAAYGTWRERGRQVCKGAKGIRILAPAGQSGGIELEDGTTTGVRRHFKLISVFDISMTEAIPA